MSDTMGAGLDPELCELAGDYGVHTGFVGLSGAWEPADPEAMVRVLECLGAPIVSPEGAGEALAARRAERRSRVIEPVSVFRLGERASLNLHLPGGAGKPYRLGSIGQSGPEICVEGRLTGDDTEACFEAGLPVGCHDLRLEVDGRAFDSLAMVTPSRAFRPADPAQWGVFAPTYMLRSRETAPGIGAAGAGDLGHLRRLVDWVEKHGGHAVSTLPLLAQFLRDLFEPSPYSPASRLFWNELFLELGHLPELPACPDAHAKLERAVAGSANELERLSAVDYRRVAELRRAVLEPLSRTFFESGGASSREFEEFLRHTGAERYAAFQATVESRGSAFSEWPERLRSGDCREGDYRQGDYRYHLYVQHRMAEQMQHLGGRARELGLGLYLDLPVGVHGAGYDLWAEPEAFLRGCTAGAPPDIVFTGGQNWGIAPLSPEGCRKQGYSYLRRVIRHHLGCAGALRIDHVMGLQRIYCVPEGFECSRGVYVGYPAHELFAALTIESHQAQAMLVGEDLGTVPAEIPEALESRGIRRMHVLEYALAGNHLTFDTLTDNAVASVNTHDLVPFAGWCSGRDISLRRDSGLVNASAEEAERGQRARMLEALEAHLRHEGWLSEQEGAEPESSRVRRLLSAVLEKYGCSASPLVLVSLEDLWFEQMPQNVPGTNSDAGNWCRRMSAALEDLDAMPGLEGLVRRLSQARNQARGREVQG